MLRWVRDCNTAGVSGPTGDYFGLCMLTNAHACARLCRPQVSNQCLVPFCSRPPPFPALAPVARLHARAPLPRLHIYNARTACLCPEPRLVPPAAGIDVDARVAHRAGAGAGSRLAST